MAHYQLAHPLRSGESPITNYVTNLEALFEEREPAVLAFVPEENRFERLRRDADALLTRFPRPESRPALFGVPVGVKDIFHVDGFATHAGSRLPPEVLRGEEAASVTKLKAAGALILGKTVTTEFAYFAPGPTRNPLNREHTPGGSSSGSAAAVGAGLCELALGTQTIGSIIRPAAFCGVTGFKPSYDRISRSGVIPLSPSVDHVGFFTPDAAGAMRAARILCEGWDEPAEPPGRPVLGIPDGPYLEHATSEALAHFQAVCQTLSQAGYELRHIAAMPDFAQIRERHNLIVAAEAARVHADWFKRYSELYAPKTTELIQRGQGIADDQLLKALEGRARLRNELAGLMQDHGIDLWISPATPGAAPRGLESTGDPVMNLPWTHAGLPTINLPSGKNEAGLPLGLQVTGGWHQDEDLLIHSQDLEKALAYR